MAGKPNHLHSNMDRILLHLEGMKSPASDTLVEDILMEEPAVKAVKSDYTTGTVTVDYIRERISPKKLEWLIEQETDFLIKK